MKEYDNQQLISVVNFLRAQGIIRNNQDFVDKVGVDRSTMSSVMSNRLGMPRTWPDKIISVFPFINGKYLRGESDEMIVKGESIAVNYSVKGMLNRQKVTYHRPDPAADHSQSRSEALLGKLMDNLASTNAMLASALEENRRLAAENADLREQLASASAQRTPTPNKY